MNEIYFKKKHNIHVPNKRYFLLYYKNIDY